MEKRLFRPEESQWEALRKDVTKGVYAMSLLQAVHQEVKAAVIRVSPGGEFPLHKDPYHHIFYFLKGTGEGFMGDDTFAIAQGLVAEIPAGTLHAYKNTGQEELVLIALNITDL
jgi:mannose-6-phosphate isomerase-like protein (cupin superfamily)